MNNIMNSKVEIEKIFCENIHYDKFNEGDWHNIALYGAGAMGEMALDFLELINVTPKYILDTNKNGKLRGIDIIHPVDIPKNDLENLTFVVCVVTAPIAPIESYLKKFGCKYIRHFYDYTEVMLKNELTNGWACFDPTSKDIESITKICTYLNHDEYSVAHYLQFLWWRLRRVEKIYENFPVLSNKKYFKAPCMPKLSNSEVFLDGGAHFGTTIQEFIKATDGNCGHILAFEPDKQNAQILKDMTKELDKSKITIYNDGLSDKIEKKQFVDNLGFASKIDDNGDKTISTVTIDSLNIQPTIIKLHLEGYELKALYGAKETIEKHGPILMVLADHNEDGLYKIAEFLISLENYKLYFYLHDYCGNSAVYYAIPKERLS